MKRFVYIFVLIFALTLATEVQARVGNHLSNYEPKSMYVPQELELNGIVRSSGNHPNDCGVELEFVEAKTGEVTFISEPGELAQLHCAKEKDFLVRLKAEKTSRFLFWGGGLKVLEFQVLQESEAQPHKQVQNSRESSFDRGDMRRLGR